MRVCGIDFTSAPSPRKPITWATCVLDGDHLRFEGLACIRSFDGFERMLRSPGPWVAGFDFPFGQSRKLVEGLGWPRDWSAYVAAAATLGRGAFRVLLEDYKRDRPPGDREHPRGVERGTGAASPQKLYGVPVALMFFEGAPRLLAAGLDLPGLAAGDPGRTGVEAYPGVLARRLIGRRPYKSDARAGDTPDRAAARRALLAGLAGDRLRQAYGLAVTAPDWLADAASADALDALLCAVQAAWAWRAVLTDRARLAPVDPLEGWIADPQVLARMGGGATAGAGR